MKVLIAVISDLATDMRVHKQALLLAEMGCDVTVIGRRKSDTIPLTLPGIKTLKIRVPFNKGPAMYLAFNTLLFFRLLPQRFDMYVSCDLDTLVPCFLVSRLYRKKLVYDAHEYFTGQYGLAERRLKYNIWKTAEKWILPELNHMITVSDSIAELYRSEYGVEPVVVRNLALPVAHLVRHDRITLGATPDELLVIFQGSGINEGRGAEELVNAMSLVEGVKLLIVGSGDIIDHVHRSVLEKGDENKIVFLPRMPWEEMMRYTMCCDAGLSLDADNCTNHRYSLPNKLFDYISAGIPVIASNLPEVSAVIKEYNCGMILRKVTPSCIAEILAELRDDRAFLMSLKKNAEEAQKELTWEKEKVKEQKFFKDVMDLNGK
jgi:glycosyltransferase involved in cell wall biosynthesis